jgi:hypothetical protein
VRAELLAALSPGGMTQPIDTSIRLSSANTTPVYAGAQGDLK